MQYKYIQQSEWEKLSTNESKIEIIFIILTAASVEKGCKWVACRMKGKKKYIEREIVKTWNNLECH
jgi:hypothetical protein